MGSIADWITLHRRGELEDPQTDDEGREGAGTIEYPNEVPQAAELEERTDPVQPAIVVGAGVLLLGAVVTAIVMAQRRIKQYESS